VLFVCITQVTQAETDGGTLPNSYEVGSILNLADYAFPAGWIQVPGNGTFGTNNFWVMQYDAKCVNASANTPLGVGYDTGYQTYNNSGYPCTSANGDYVASAVSGYPIANISQTSAQSYCQSIGANLITNAQWQTIVWNAENQGVNWSSGVVGTGNMARGNSNSSWAQSDSNPEGLAGSTSTYQTGFVNLRTETLSNSSTIWDMAGNVWQWTNDTITGTNEPHGAPASWNWLEFTAITSWGSMTQSTAGPLNAAWNSSQDIGMIYSENATDATVYGFTRGGRWTDGATAGLETLILINTPGNTYYYTGFRCTR
jgi:formylglycine-generating enzyme required for sulfatase activity